MQTKKIFQKHSSNFNPRLSKVENKDKEMMLIKTRACIEDADSSIFSHSHVALWCLTFEGVVSLKTWGFLFSPSCIRSVYMLNEDFYDYLFMYIHIFKSMTSENL